MRKIVFAVLTVSDTCYQDAAKDRSGPRLKQLIQDAFKNSKIITDVIPDERDLIEAKLKELVTKKELDVSVIITTGGTGFAPRDVTPEATRAVLDKECNALSTALVLASLEKTKFAALTRGICGISGQALIMNFPGSEKAVTEYFEIVKDLLPHALHLINNDLELVKEMHRKIQFEDNSSPPQHVCPHKTGSNTDSDRNSPFPMISVDQALNIIFEKVQQKTALNEFLLHLKSPTDIPPFRASIKDGYAMKSSGFSGTKKVVGCISAGDPINTHVLEEDECFKINTGAPIPETADCVIQIEDTKLEKRKKNGDEDLVTILKDPSPNLDIRPIGCDLAIGSKLFPSVDLSTTVIRSLMASVGERIKFAKPSIAVLSTGSELLAPLEQAQEGKIFDSNTTMLEELLESFGFQVTTKMVLPDNFEDVELSISKLYEKVDFIICSGGVSMGDRDLIKDVLEKLKFQLHFGRVNMKPGKPMTFASNSNNTKYFFGLPGNPVSAFVTFHLFALPALRWFFGWQKAKCTMPQIKVSLDNDQILLDPRPEYLRASITSKDGEFFASITGNQMSSCLQSIVGADVLVHLPGRTKEKTHAKTGDVYTASILRYDFISFYA